MITAKDFKKKIFTKKEFVADLVEEKLSKILPNGKVKNSFSISYDDVDAEAYIDFCDCIIKELENRGFVNVDYGFSDDTIDFYFEVEFNGNDQEDKKSYDVNSLVVTNKTFMYVDRQLKTKDEVKLIFSSYETSDWYNIGKTLQARYTYVVMKRLDREHNTVEGYIQTHHVLDVIANCDIFYFEFFVYKNKSAYILNSRKLGAIIDFSEI